MPGTAFAAYMRSPQFIYTYDSVVSAVMGLAFLLFAGAIADLAGWPAAAGFVGALGSFLLSWALFNYAIGTAGSPSRSSVLANMAGDAVWFVAGAALLFLHWEQFNLLGRILIFGQAVFVAGVLTIKLRGASALRKT